MRGVLLTALLVAVCVPCCHAADTRLVRPVTYQGGYKRLHAVAEELAQQTGVTIRAGTNKQDWRVRDIPLVVFVKDMPLGKLLERIAQCAHVRLVAEKIAGARDEKPAYRLYRNKNKADDIQLQLDARVEANRKTAEWAWDTLVKYADMPDASADLPKPKPVDPNAMTITLNDEMEGTRIRLVAKALASLDPDAKAKALAGEQVTVRVGASGPRKELYDYAVKNPGIFSFGRPVAPTEAELRDALIAIKFHRQDRPDRSAGFSFYVHGMPVEMQLNGRTSRTWDSWQAEPVMCAKALANVKRLKLPPAPEVETALQDAPPPGFKALKDDTDYKLPMLQAKVKLASPQPGDKPRVEAIKAMAAAGVNIICEDFQSHKLGRYTTVMLSGTEVPAADILKDMGKGPFSVVWHVDEKEGTLLGWAREWRKAHQSLVSESLHESIVAKCRQEGGELDDLAPLWDLTRDQVTEWFAETADLPGIEAGHDGYGVAAWRLYNALSADDKLLARSDAGLPLAALDAGSVLELFRKCKEESDNGSVLMAMPDNSIDKTQGKYLNADSIGKLVMRVRSRELSMWIVRPLADDGDVGWEMHKAQPNEPKKHGWSVSLVDPASPGTELFLGGEWQDVAFPVFTPEREAELRRKAHGVAKEK